MSIKIHIMFTNAELLSSCKGYLSHYTVAKSSHLDDR